MHNAVFGLLTVLSFFGVGSIDTQNVQRQITFDLGIKFLYKIFSSLYLFFLFSNWLTSVEEQMVNSLFITWDDWFLFKTILVGTVSISTLLSKEGKVIYIVTNLCLIRMVQNLTLYINFAFDNLLFEHIVIPIIQILVSILGGLGFRALEAPKNKLKNISLIISTVYFFIILIMVHKHKLIN